MESKPQILFVCHRIPYPPNRGDKIRSYNLLKQLSKEYDVMLGCCVETQEELEYVEYLKNYTVDIHCAYKSNSTLHIFKDLLAAVIYGKAVSEQHFYHPSLRNWVNSKVNNHNIRGAFIYCSSMAQYIPKESSQDFILVTDLIDLDSHKWLELANSKSPPLSWLYRRESQKIAQLEQKLIEQADNAFFVSQQELSLSRNAFGNLANSCDVVENGVDYDYFSSSNIPQVLSSDSKNIVFTGSMDGVHNIESISWFLQYCWTQLVEKHPGLKLFIVGRRPPVELKRHANEQIIFESDVPDIRPYIAGANVIIAPMQHSRGVQNKILEAMASGKAVVTTNQGAEGIAFPEEQLPFICNNADDFVDKTSALLLNPDLRESIGLKNKSWVKEHYIWQTKLESLNQYFHGKN